MDSNAFIIGNGTSRQYFDLNKLANHGTTYGCNALYRDFHPDHLISVDIKMIKEIYDSGYMKKNKVWCYYHKTLERMKNINFLSESLGWSSGPSALWLASVHGYDNIYLIGFDFVGLNNGKLFNNIYADTQNYKRSIQPATYFRNWLSQTYAIIKHNQHINYIRIIPEYGYEPNEFSDLKNYISMNYQKFHKLFGF